MREEITIRDTAERWVSEMNAIPGGMIDKLMSIGDGDIYEVTEPAVGDSVYFYADLKGSGDGEITGVDNKDDGVVYTIELETFETVKAYRQEFEVVYDDALPMWGTLWSFGDIADDWWLEDGDGIKIMSECGFKIYESDEFGYFFGIDGAGYNFYEAHWIPLYKARGLQWHDPVSEQEYQMTKKGYRKRMLGSSMYWVNGNGDVVEEVAVR